MNLNTYSKIIKEYQDLQDSANNNLEIRKNEIYEKIPRIREIDEELRNLSIEITKAILHNTSDANNLIEKLHQSSMSLQIEKGEILSSNNYPTDYLTIKYNCKNCQDTGYIENKKCSCFIQKMINFAYEASNLSSLMNTQNFDNFDFSFYSPEIDNNKGISQKENMQSIYKTCLNFTENFDTLNENLLFSGDVGLGKTFLSSCIAKELLDKGYTVYYQSAFKIFDNLSDYQFNKNINISREDVDILFDVDLLIIDDLGSEFINSYTVSEFFNILNSRLLSGKKTIISTNYSFNELSEIYTPRVASRIFGHYKILEFFGEDIRNKISINIKE